MQYDQFVDFLKQSLLKITRDQESSVKQRESLEARLSKAQAIYTDRANKVRNSIPIVTKISSSSISISPEMILELEGASKIVLMVQNELKAIKYQIVHRHDMHEKMEVLYSHLMNSGTPDLMEGKRACLQDLLDDFFDDEKSDGEHVNKEMTHDLQTFPVGYHEVIRDFHNLTTRDEILRLMVEMAKNKVCWTMDVVMMYCFLRNDADGYRIADVVADLNRVNNLIFSAEALKQSFRENVDLYDVLEDKVSFKLTDKSFRYVRHTLLSKLVDVYDGSE